MRYERAENTAGVMEPMRCGDMWRFNIGNVPFDILILSIFS